MVYVLEICFFFIVVIDGGLDDSEFEFKFDEVGDK